MEFRGLKNNSLPDVWRWFTESIRAFYDENEAQAVTNLVFEEYFDLKAIDKVLQKERRFSESEIVKLWGALEKLQLHIPVQYILGHAYWAGYKLKINSSVLIPRPETEELVLWIAETCSQEQTLHHLPLKIWDIGTGSGAIAIALSHAFPKAQVFASDISKNALEVAHENSKSHKLDIHFFQNDILQEYTEITDLDIIVSNPPYVCESEKSQMRKNVLDYEPEAALFVSDKKPLIFYKAIAQTARKALKKGGILFFEINEAFGKETCEMLETLDFVNVQIRKDIHNKDRFVKGVKA